MDRSIIIKVSLISGSIIVAATIFSAHFINELIKKNIKDHIITNIRFM